MLAREWPCPNPCSLPKIQILQGVISLYKFFTKSVISGSKCPKVENLEIWNFEDPEILLSESVTSLHKFFTKSVISGSKRLKSENFKICSCLLVLRLCLLMLAREWPCPSPWSLPKIQILEGVISLYKFFTKSMIFGSECPKSENLEIWNSQPAFLIL